MKVLMIACLMVLVSCGRSKTTIVEEYTIVDEASQELNDRVTFLEKKLEETREHHLYLIQEYVDAAVKEVKEEIDQEIKELNESIDKLEVEIYELNKKLEKTKKEKKEKKDK